ncbi:hypothetical protein [Falsirhodobacter deserti]|uniref:hypothetical protein n=1 Tax=Falsirhodobacter deserti TaxID=1365611 RepID=UPI0013E286AA|nr:hypothetical protein [Falsirhodobacter deserti]
MAGSALLLPREIDRPAAAPRAQLRLLTSGRLLLVQGVWRRRLGWPESWQWAQFF